MYSPLAEAANIARPADAATPRRTAGTPPTSIIGDSAKKPARNGHHRGHKSEVEVAERDTHEHEAREKEPAPVEVATVTPPEGQNVKVTAPTPSGDTTQSTSIGILTAGTAPDNTGSRQQAAAISSTPPRAVSTPAQPQGRSEQNSRPDTQLPRPGTASPAQRGRRRR